MAFDVDILVSGDGSQNNTDKGDVVAVKPSTAEWGSSEVTPAWIRLTVTDVPGDTQAEAEGRINELLESWHTAFSYSEVEGAGEGEQRYRIEAIPEIANDLNQAKKIQIRDALVSALGGTVADQGTTFVEIDGPPGFPLDELENIIMTIGFKRYYFPSNLIDAVLSGVTPGDPVEVTRAYSSTTQPLGAKQLVVDKLKS